METVLDVKKIPKKYWYDAGWLGLSSDIPEPTYFHILGVDPEEVGNIAADQMGQDVENRIRAKIKNDPGAIEVGNSVLGVISKARGVLGNEQKRSDYVSELVEAYGEDVKEIIREFEIYWQHELADNTKNYEYILETGSIYSLTRAQADAVINEERAKLSEQKILDPAAPTYFELLEIPETLTDSQISLVERNRDRLIAEMEDKIKKTNRVELKQKYAAKIPEIKKAAEVLVDSRKREQYKHEILELRIGAFERVGRIKPGTTEISEEKFKDLIQKASPYKLSSSDVRQFLKAKGIRVPGDIEPSNPRLRPIQPLNLGRLLIGREERASFTIANDGGGILECKLASEPWIGLSNTMVKVGAGDEKNVLVTLNLVNITPGEYSGKIMVLAEGQTTIVPVRFAAELTSGGPAYDQRLPGIIYASNPPKNPVHMAIASFFLAGLGQLILGQTAKGIALFVLLLLLFSLNSAPIGLIYV
ncbi:MAG: hypothetical protein ABIC40_05410, partial [bacterium]